MKVLISKRIVDCPDETANCTGISRSAVGDHDERVILPDGTFAPAGPANNQYTGMAENR